MTAVFLRLVNLSICAGWLVLAVLVLRLVLWRAPKWVNVLLWGIVAVRLALPFSIASGLSLIPSASTIDPEVVQFAAEPAITSGIPIIDNAVNPIFHTYFAADPAQSVNPLYVWTEVAGILWLCGLVCILIWGLASYLRLRKRVSASLPLGDNIYLSDEALSPFILGILRPRIYLPSGMDETQQTNVLAHERAHLARYDHWWKPVGFVLLAVYWFHPLLWLAYALLCRDIELACDERVIRDMDAGAIRTYSAALLSCSLPGRSVYTCPLAFGEVGVKTRVKNILRYKKPAFWTAAAAVILCAVVAVCFLTVPAKTHPLPEASSDTLEDSNLPPLTSWTVGEGLDRTFCTPVGFGDYRVVIGVSYRLENDGHRIAQISGAQALTEEGWLRGWFDVKQDVDIDYDGILYAQEGNSVCVPVTYYASIGAGFAPYDDTVVIPLAQ